MSSLFAPGKGMLSLFAPGKGMSSLFAPVHEMGGVYTSTLSALTHAQLHTHPSIPSLQLPFTDAHIKTDSDNAVVVSLRLALCEINANFKGRGWKLTKCDKHLFLIKQT
jgi:hypothetical protein